jgi:hypothetical protein
MDLELADTFAAAGWRPGVTLPHGAHTAALNYTINGGERPLISRAQDFRPCAYWSTDAGEAYVAVYRDRFPTPSQADMNFRLAAFIRRSPPAPSANAPGDGTTIEYESSSPVEPEGMAWDIVIGPKACRIVGIVETAAITAFLAEVVMALQGERRS